MADIDQPSEERRTEDMGNDILSHQAASPPEPDGVQETEGEGEDGATEAETRSDLAKLSVEEDCVVLR